MQFNGIRFPVVIYLIGFTILGLVLAASFTFDIHITRLMADPVQVHNSKFYIGFMSNLTVITWCIGAYLAIFTWSILKRTGGEIEWIRFFKIGGFLTLVLMLDDLFMFHERIFPHYLFLPKITGFRPNEKFPIFAYGIFTLWFLYSCRHTIKKTPWLHLLIAGGFLATSIIIDRGIGKYLVPSKFYRSFIEDASKFIGVLGWSWYFFEVSRAILVARMDKHGVLPASAKPETPSAEL